MLSQKLWNENVLLKNPFQYSYMQFQSHRILVISKHEANSYWEIYSSDWGGIQWRTSIAAVEKYIM
jgi:hypothetical protein